MILENYLHRLQENAESNYNYDIDEFFSRLNKVIPTNTEVKEFGYAREHPIMFIHPKVLTPKPKVLIVAGFHGDESSGPWSIVNFLESNLYSTSVNLSLLPLVNPTGFNLSRRSNFWGEVPNRGYYNKGYDSNEKPSHEDKILKENMDLLYQYGKDCLVTLHEDDEESFYLFTYSELDKLDKKLIKMGEEKFGLVPLSRLKVGGFKSRDDGIRIDDKDSSFEHGMLVMGVKKSITVENPNRKPFEERVELYIEMIKEICKPNYYE